MTRYLSSFKTLDTRNTEETRSVVLDIYDALEFEVTGGADRFHAKAAHFNFGISSLYFTSHHGTTRARFRDRNYVRFQLAVSGVGETSSSMGAGNLDCNTVVVSPSGATLETIGTLDQLVLRIDQDALARDLCNLLGFRPRQELAFNTRNSTDNERTRIFRDLVSFTANAVGSTKDAAPAALLREMDQLLRLTALFGIANNFSDVINAEQKLCAPWQVQRVEDWIDAHWNEQVTIDKLAEVSGASARSIFLAFRNSRGYTPMLYLRRARLKAARDMLVNAEPDASVTGVAFACNFMTVGHFSRYYRERFGESPSETLRRGKSRL